MAEDIQIDIEIELGKALQNLQQLEKSLKAVKKSVDSELDPSINNFGTKLSGLGGKVSGFGSKIQNAISGPTALAFTALGAGVTSFTKQCIDSAISSEAAWTRFGALVNQSGGNWSQQSNEIKSWATSFSNSMGYAVSDTREAATAFMQFGLSVDQMKTAMNATAGVAARTGMTEAEASSMVISALNGKGKQLEKMTGLRMEDYKTADGQIDRERLLNDLYNSNTDAIKAHGDTTEAQMNRINNSWGKFKTGIGQALMPAVKIVADFIEKVVNGFNSLDGPQKTIVAVFLAIVAVVTTAIGILGMIAPIIINVGNLMSSAGKWIGKLKVPGGVSKTWESFKGALTSVKDKITGMDLGSKLSGIKDSVSQKWTTISKKISTVKDKITGMDLGSKLQGIKDSISQRWDTLAQKISNVKSKITGMDLGSKLQGIRESISQRWSSLATRISNVKSRLSGMDLGSKLQGIKESVMSRWNTIGTRISNVKSRLSGMHLGERLNGIKGSVLQGWSTIRTRISSAKAALAGMHLGERLNGIKSAVISGWNAFKAAVNSAKVALLGNAAAEGTSTISTIAHSVANGVRTAATTVATAAQTALNVATMAGLGPILLIVGAIAAFVAILAYLYFNNETVRNSINALVGILRGALMGAWNALSGVISAVANILQSTLGPAITFIMQAFQILSNTVGQITSIFSRVMDGSMSLGDAFNAIGQILSNAGGLLWNAAMEAGRQMLEGFKTSVGQAIDGAKTAVSGFIDSVVQFFSELPGKIVETISKIPQMIGDALSSLGDMVIPGGGLVAGILSIFLPIPAAIVGLINNFAPEVIPAITGFIGNVAGSFGDIGASILSSIGNGLGMVRDGILNFMGGIADTLSGLGNLPVIGPVFDALAGSVRTAASVFGIFSNAAVGIVNVFSQLFSGTMSLGDAFNAITGILGGAFTGVQTIIGNFINTIIMNFAGIGQRILQGFLNIPQMLGQFFMLAVQQIQARLTQARAIAGMLVQMLVQAVVLRFNMLVARVRMVFAGVVNAIRSRLASARNIAGNLAQMIRNVIVTRFNLIIARVRSIFQRIVSTVRQRLSSAASAAREKAQEILQGIKDKVSQIPQAVADEFNKIKDRISSALDNAKNVAVQKIGDLVAAVKGALGIASPGYIQRMTAGEFESIPMHIATQAVNAVREATKMASGIVDAWYDNTSNLTVPSVSMGEVTVPDIRAVLSDEINSLPDIFVATGVRVMDTLEDIASSIQSTWTNTVDSLTIPEIRFDGNVPDVQSVLADEFGALPAIVNDVGVRVAEATSTMVENMMSIWNSLRFDEITIPSWDMESINPIVPTVDLESIEPVNLSSLVSMDSLPALQIQEQLTTNNPVQSLLENSIDLFSDNTLLNGIRDFGILTTDYNIPNTTTNNSNREIITNNTTDDHQTHIHIDKIELDCNNLTKQESRNILYQALDGLYTGGI